MSGFENFEAHKAAWLTWTGTLESMGIPWKDDPDDWSHLWNFVMLGEHQEAADFSLDRWLTLPMARNPMRHQKRYAAVFGPVYEEPRVAARLADLDREFEQMREDVREMLQGPEWN
jgi:hypothetical protein